MNRLRDPIRRNGFTIVELLVVVVVIGILAAISIAVYNGVTKSARDNAVLSDAQAVENEVVRYGTSNNGTYGSIIEWYSEGAANSNIQFVPTEGNIIDVVANSTDYCIRVYNPKSQLYITLYDAYTKGSSGTACDLLTPSSLAVAGNGGAGASIANAISGISDRYCAVTPSSKAFCWGSNPNGQLGNNTTTDSALPVEVDGTGALSGKTIKSVQVGQSVSCAIASDDQAYCWGYGISGGLGNNSTSSSAVPVAVSTSGVLAGKTVKSLHMGSSHACAIASDNQAYCWGSGQYGKLGNGSTSNALVPVAVTTSGVLSGKTIKQLAVTNNNTCVIASDDKIYCWGLNGTNGLVGNNSTTNATSPVAVNASGVLSGKTIKSMAIGNNHKCVIASDDKAYCWGNNDMGNLGNTTAQTYSRVPIAVNATGVLSGKLIKTIVISPYSVSTSEHTCAIDTNDLAYCWGYGAWGQLGSGTTSAFNDQPVAVSTSGVLSGKTIEQLTINIYHTCAIASDDKAYCWGQGFAGALGNGSTDNSAVPSPVSMTGVLASKKVKSIRSGSMGNCMIVSTNQVYCWGDGTSGQLGNGSTIESSVPVNVSGFGL